MNKTIVQRLDAFFSQYSKRVFAKNDIILQAGQEPTGVFYIESGVVRNYWISRGGTEVTLNMYKPHTFLPMSWAIADVTNNNFYEAMTQTTARKAPKDVFLNFLKNEPDIVYDLLRRIYIGIDGLWIHIESLTTGSAYSKLVTSLIILAKRFGKKEKNRTVIQLTMNARDIANYAGMSRETVSRELQKLKKGNYVSFGKGVIVLHNMQALENMLLH